MPPSYAPLSVGEAFYPSYREGQHASHRQERHSNDDDGTRHNICLLTMMNEKARRDFALPLRSQKCYAERHNLTRGVEILEQYKVNAAVGPVGPTPPQLHKLEVIDKWLRDDRCDWLMWLDADVYITMPEVPLRHWLQPPHARLIMTDHSQAINNGGFFLRSSAWAREYFLPLWASLSIRGDLGYPFTDNGSMYEAILQAFVKGYKPLSCHPRVAPVVFVKCVSETLARAFGPVQTTGWRGGGGLKLMAPLSGFNSHGCHDGSSLLNCSTWKRWKTHGHGQYGWEFNDMYRLPPPGKPPIMFALHAKHFESAQKMSPACAGSTLPTRPVSDSSPTRKLGTAGAAGGAATPTSADYAYVIW